MTSFPECRSACCIGVYIHLFTKTWEGMQWSGWEALGKRDRVEIRRGSWIKDDNETLVEVFFMYIHSGKPAQVIRFKTRTNPFKFQAFRFWYFSLKCRENLWMMKDLIRTYRIPTTSAIILTITKTPNPQYVLSSYRLSTTPAMILTITKTPIP